LTCGVLAAVVVLVSGRPAAVHATAADKVTVRITSGRTFCQATRAPDGWYTARHCTQHPGGVWTFDGSRAVPPWSVDLDRDLAHFVGPPADVTMRAPHPGGGKTAIMADGKESHYSFQRPVAAGDCYLVETGPNMYANWCLETGGREGERFDFYCYIDGKRPGAGDCGVGMRSDLDDALVGIVTHGGPVPGYLCASGYAALAVEVP
jgi:hypothetical protein